MPKRDTIVAFPEIAAVPDVTRGKETRASSTSRST